jgi:redox-sensitive bicupin YhaK (pirin superfamily)
LVQPGTGFETHPHRDMEIVTWVLDGSLVHQDSSGHSGVIYPGLAQRMSAGTGILHSEKNDSSRLAGERPTTPVHFLQTWVLPDEADIAPGYEQLEIGDELLTGALSTVASGMDKRKDASAIRIQNRHAALHAARLLPGQHVVLPEAPHLHLFVVRLGGPRRYRRARRGRCGPLHHHRRAPDHRHRTGRVPGLRDARHRQSLTTRASRDRPPATRP